MNVDVMMVRDGPLGCGLRLIFVVVAVRLVAVRRRFGRAADQKEGLSKVVSNRILLTGPPQSQSLLILTQMSATLSEPVQRIELSFHMMRPKELQIASEVKRDNLIERKSTTPTRTTGGRANVPKALEESKSATSAVSGPHHNAHD